MEAMRRYALYWAPGRETALWRFGCAWLGRDPETGARPEPPEVPGLPAPRAEIVAEPARYGWHATLKPPFRLAPGRRPAGLLAAAGALAATTAPFALPPLRPVVAHGFLSLRPAEPCPALDRLAALAVTEADAFRAPPAPEELARRRAAGLTPRQEALLARWGYPWVMEEFRFHLTLTGPLGNAAARAVAEALAETLAPFAATPHRVEGLALCGETEAGHFRLLRRLPLAG